MSRERYCIYTELRERQVNLVPTTALANKILFMYVSVNFPDNFPVLTRDFSFYIFLRIRGKFSSYDS